MCVRRHLRLNDQRTIADEAFDTEVGVRMMKCVNAMRAMRAMRAVIAAMLAAVLATSMAPWEARGQDLADYDYENLSFRGVSFEVGYLFADNVKNTETLGVRFDLGFLGPGFRLMPGVTYWESRMAQPQVEEFEARLGTLIEDQGGIVPLGGFDLGVIERSDIVLGLDGHYVWAVPKSRVKIINRKIIEFYGKPYSDKSTELDISRVEAQKLWYFNPPNP